MAWEHPLMHVHPSQSQYAQAGANGTDQVRDITCAEVSMAAGGAWCVVDSSSFMVLWK